MSNLDKIIKLLYDTTGAAGVARVGFYDLQKSLFRAAAAEYLKTGKNHLPDLDKIKRAEWYERSYWRRRLLRPVIKKSEKKLLENFLKGRGFWAGKYHPIGGSINEYLADAQD